MAKITGIGGVFFKSTGDHKRLSEWYASNLGLQLEDSGDGESPSFLVISSSDS